MKHLYLNLKRFDVPVEYGGVNRIAPLKDWGSYIVSHTQDGLKKYDPSQVEFVQYFPEAHILGAVSALCENSPVQVGCQGVYRMNTAVGGNFGAFTTNRPASIAKAMGCTSTCSATRFLRNRDRIVEKKSPILRSISEARSLASTAPQQGERPTQEGGLF